MTADAADEAPNPAPTVGPDKGAAKRGPTPGRGSLDEAPGDAVHIQGATGHQSLLARALDAEKARAAASAGLHAASTSVKVVDAGRHRVADVLAQFVHLVHGSRGLLLAAFGLLIMALVEPTMQSGVNRLPLILPLFVLLVIGVSTLPREGLAAQERACKLLDDQKGARKMSWRLFWPGLLCILLAPKVFLGMYGIPYLNPLSGLVTQEIIRRISLIFLFIVLLVAVLYLRSGRRYAPEVMPMRPMEIKRDDRADAKRDALLVALGLLLLGWGFLARTFWEPFSLLQWPPSLDTLDAGSRGLAAISFSLVIPAVLFMVLVSHLALLRAIYDERRWEQRGGLIILSLAHIGLILLALRLHLQNLFFIVEYQSASFLT